jgi:hypothetical protein
MPEKAESGEKVSAWAQPAVRQARTQYKALLSVPSAGLWTPTIAGGLPQKVGIRMRKPAG